jgi:hypothetical protein
MRDKLTDLKARRNYAQEERDLIGQFYTNTRTEYDDCRVKIANKETELEQLEDNHRVEVKVYLQKVKHLEYDQHLTNKRIKIEGDEAVKTEDEYHKDRLLNMKDDKMKKKKEYHENERNEQSEVKQLQQTHEKTLKRLKAEYDGKIDNTINNYEHMLVKLREELELKIKVKRNLLSIILIEGLGGNT